MAREAGRESAREEFAPTFLVSDLHYSQCRYCLQESAQDCWCWSVQSSWRYLPTTRDIYEPIAHQLSVSGEIVKRVGILRAVGSFPIYSSPSHGRRQNSATASMVAFVRSGASRILRMTLLAPDIVEAILDGRQPPDMTLAALMRPFAVEWSEQVAVRYSSQTSRTD